MATRPELHVAIAKTKNKASEYNDNFDMMMDYCEATATEAKDYVDTTLAGNVFSRNIGEIVISTTPLIDAGLHLLDGALLSGSGSYSAFVTHIAGLVASYPDLFDTEANWQAAVTANGVCGKFVYDSVNNTVRLPKITGIIEGTTDLTALGDLIQAGLPNITGTFGGNDKSDVTTGAFAVDTANVVGQGGGGSQPKISFSASRSNSIYGSSSTVQPQTIKVLYYIVIATSTKTDIEVDIDEIATDLNGKADVDLANVTNTSGFRKLVDVYKNDTSWYKVYREYNPSDGTLVGLWCEEGGLYQRPSGTTNQQNLPLLNDYISIEDVSFTIVANSVNTTAYPVRLYALPTVGGSGYIESITYTTGSDSTDNFPYFYWRVCGYIN